MTEIGDAPRGKPRPLKAADWEDPKCQYFPDDREGEDRWGTPYQEKVACGTGFGEDEYVCPLYVEESCPGCKNKGNRFYPCKQRTCSLDCGVCGGYDLKSGTIAYCGQQKSERFHDGVFAEFGGSLRLDRWTGGPGEAREADFPCAYFPIVEWGGRNWMRAFLSGKVGGWSRPEHWPAEVGFPLVGTTMKTIYPGRGRAAKAMRRGAPIRSRTGLRDRLGGFKGDILVSGMVKDDLLDDCWEDRERILRWCRDEGATHMLTGQFSTYPDKQNMMLVYNTNRAFWWYERAMELGFKHVILDIPTDFHARWIMDEHFDYAERSGCKVFALYYAHYRARGGMDPRTVWNARLVHDCMPKDAAVMLFGPSTLQRIAGLARIFRGRQMIFSTVEAYARSAFYRLVPGGISAPAGMEKDEVFARNVESMEKLAIKGMSKGAGYAPGAPANGNSRQSVTDNAGSRPRQATGRRRSLFGG
jgi:hypothetical protein